MKYRFALLGVIFVSSFTVKLKQGFRSEFLTFSDQLTNVPRLALHRRNLLCKGSDFSPLTEISTFSRRENVEGLTMCSRRQGQARAIRVSYLSSEVARWRGGGSTISQMKWRRSRTRLLSGSWTIFKTSVNRSRTSLNIFLDKHLLG